MANLTIGDMIDALTSHAMTTGYFDSVNAHEPDNAPGNGLTAAIWMADISANPQRSGLAVTSANITFNVRLYTLATQMPQDAIDANMMTAFYSLMNTYIGDFELGGSNTYIDAHAFSAEAGYLKQEDILYRIMTIRLPVKSDDIWTEIA